jgi:hypothetical protein
MSGSFERQIYDTQAYKASLEESTRPLMYRLDPIAHTRCDPCRSEQPGYNGRSGVSITHQRPLIDVESDLLRLNIKASKDPKQAYISTCPQCGECMEGYPCGGGVAAGCTKCQEKLHHLPSCGPFTDYTRISNPIATARGVGINRFQPLCLNPQDENRWLHPSEVGISYRHVVKDNHVPQIPKVLDHTPLLPKGSGPVKCPKVPTACGAHIAPMHKHGKANLDRHK